MPKIEILEQDLTTPGVVSENTDIVYVPGLVDTSQKSLWNAEGEYIGLNVNEPHLFNSAEEFVTLCGKAPATFKSAQKYSDLVVGEKATDVPAFGKTSWDVSSIMFNAGDPDPGYILAKELLASGLSVVYERLNPDAVKEHYEAYTDDTAPSSTNMYYKSGDKYILLDPHERNVSSTQPPAANSVMLAVLSMPETGGGEDSATYYKLSNGEFVPYGTEETKVANNCYTFAEVSEVKKEDWITHYMDYAFVSDGKYLAYRVPGYVPNETYKKVEASDSINVSTVYSGLLGVFDTTKIVGIIDKGNYSVKYLTSGGYPTFEYDGGALVVKMLEFAEKRGDCVALIDHTDYMDRELNPTKVGSLYNTAQLSKSLFTSSGEYGAMFTPWATYNRSTSDYVLKKVTNYEGTSFEQEVDKELIITDYTKFRAPGSFAYLMSLADSIKTNANWLAVAGVTRGKVRNLASDGMTTVIPNGVADALQPRKNAVTINAITNISPYGYTIWGNRTLKPVEEDLVATNFLNIRNLISDIKKTCYRVARKTTFEQNTDILWVNFSSEIGKLLERMKAGFGISGYKILKDTEHIEASKKATLCAKIIIYPTYAVEDFYITVVLKDDEVVVQ